MRALAYRDPSPSRFRYRFERLWLKHSVRRLFGFWIPVGVLGAVVWTASGDPAVRMKTLQLRDDLRVVVAARPELQVRSTAFPNVTEALQQQILAITGLSLPISTLDLDVAALKAVIETLDAVKSVEVQVVGDGVLEIRAIERTPQMVWRDGETLRLIDDEGQMVAVIARRSARGDLPLIVGQSADVAITEAFALLQASVPISERVRGLVRVGERRWDLVLDRGQTIMLPESGPVTALRRVLELHETQDLLNRDVTVIDMRDMTRPVLRLSDTAITELRRLRTQVRGEDA